MSHFSRLVIRAHALSSWAAQKPHLIQVLGLALAMGVALAAALLNPGTLMACPACGSGGG